MAVVESPVRGKNLVDLPLNNTKDVTDKNKI